MPRIRLEPQRSWEANEPDQLATALQTLERVQEEFNSGQADGKKVSLADLIVLGGCRGGGEGSVRTPGSRSPCRSVRAARTRHRNRPTSSPSGYLQPRADGFRNYVRPGVKLQPETLLLDKAYLLDLSAPEMTALVGGMRALGTNVGGSGHGVLTDRPQVLTNDFFVNLLSPGTKWKASED